MKIINFLAVLFVAFSFFAVKESYSQNDPIKIILGGYNNNNTYDNNGYDQYGYDRQGYDREGYNRNGYDRQGYDRNGYDRYGNSRYTDQTNYNGRYNDGDRDDQYNNDNRYYRHDNGKHKGWYKNKRNKHNRDYDDD